LPNVDVVAILKSGAYQDARFDNREYKREAAERAAIERHAYVSFGTVRIFAPDSAFHGVATY
jgi:hypothetical protein